MVIWLTPLPPQLSTWFMPSGWILPKKIWYWISDGKNPIPVLDQYIRFTNVYYQCLVPRKSSTSTRQINASFYQAVYYQKCTKISPLLFYHDITRKLPIQNTTIKLPDFYQCLRGFQIPGYCQNITSKLNYQKTTNFYQCLRGFKIPEYCQNIMSVLLEYY